MPPATKYTKEKILNTALKLVIESGVDSLSARNVAANLKCSTAPIYWSFASIDDLIDSVIGQAREILREYCNRKYTDRPFLNQGTGLVLFAQEYPQLFHLLFLSRKQSKKTIPLVHSAIIEDMKRDERFTSFTLNQRKAILEKLWFASIGMATLAYSGQLNANSVKTIATLLTEAGTVLIPAALAQINSKKRTKS